MGSKGKASPPGRPVPPSGGIMPPGPPSGGKPFRPPSGGTMPTGPPQPSGGAMPAAAPLLPAAGAACESPPPSFCALAAAAADLLLRRPEPGGTSRSVPPAVQYRWHVCRWMSKGGGVDGTELSALRAATEQHLARPAGQQPRHVHSMAALTRQ